MEKNMRARTAVGMLCALWIGASGAGALSSPTSDAKPIQIAGFYLPEPLPLEAFSLLDQDGKAFTAAALHDQWTLLFFGYTHCPDVCPTTLAQIRAVKKQLASSATPLKLGVVFVSIDPQRDSSEQLRQYVSQFGDDFVGVGGPPLHVDSFAKQFRVKYAISGGTSSTYFIDHTSSVALITPRGQLRALFSAPLQPDTTASDIQRISLADAPKPARTAPVDAVSGGHE
jgi:protein SCO1/2